MINYTIMSHCPSSHIFNVTLSFEPHTSEQALIMPCWIPGSYTIRDFARHVVQLKLSNDCIDSYEINKINSYTWVLKHLRPQLNLSPVTIEYEVYAWDRSVRGAHLDTTHAFMNLNCLCLMVVGQQKGPHQVKICMPNLSRPSKEPWRVATTLTPFEIDDFGFGQYSAKSYEALIDHPIEIGCFDRVSFIVNDIVHEIVITGQHHGDIDRLKKDVQKITQTHHDFFYNHPTIRSPFEKYCFLLTLVGEGYGGLEHRSSTALINTRVSMPKRSDLFKLSTDYRNLLALFSHEYFHAWNIKCIKPAVFCPYDLTQPQYTRQLWAFEGITSYYDELALVRSGVISFEDYLQMLSDNISQLQTPGQFKQSLVEASFDAWIKFYKPDENTKNSTVSYYTKGLLAAFCLDMSLRHLTHDQANLDEVMRCLWANYKEGQGTLENEIEDLIYKKSNYSESMKELIECILYTTKALPLEQALEYVGLKLEFCLADESMLAALGISVAPVAQELLITSVLDNSAAMEAGLSAKDSLVAIEGLKVSKLADLEKILINYGVGDVFSIQAFREDRLMNFKVQLSAMARNKAKISIDSQAPELCISRRHQWLSPKV